ncbi:MAG: hypothetical protein JXA42_25050 [Anaerolineales bacterium]|nr:hypothetical protein [Anaerolineales bacterium]
MFVKLHHLVVNLDSDSSRVRIELEQLFSPFIHPSGENVEGKTKNILFQVEIASEAPSQPGNVPNYSQPGLLVFQKDHDTVLHLPELGQLILSFQSNRVLCLLAPKAIDTYGAFEDLIAMGLAPFLRRNGCVLVHAFAAALNDRAILLVGDNASGKTTTGLAFLAIGWRLVANDSPMLGIDHNQVMAFAYPGLLSATMDALNYLPTLRSRLVKPCRTVRPGWKMTFPYEKTFNSPWQYQAPVRSICLLDLQTGATQHRIEPLSPANALGRLLPHSVDRWDQGTLSFQIEILHKLVRQAPTFILHLGPDVPTLPAMLEQLVLDDGRQTL